MTIEVNENPGNIKEAQEKAGLRPHDLLAVPPEVKAAAEAAGMHLKWADRTELEQSLWDGYEIVERPDSVKMHPDGLATQVTGSIETVAKGEYQTLKHGIERRGMVLVQIPQEKVQAMERAIQDQVDRQEQAIRENHEQMRDRERHRLKRQGLSNREVDHYMRGFEVDIGPERPWRD